MPLAALATKLAPWLSYGGYRAWEAMAGQKRIARRGNTFSFGGFAMSTASMSVLLADATVQDIQLELIRRTVFNSMNGEQIHASLMRHRALWTAVLLDRPGVGDHKYGGLHLGGLIKLRDLPDNVWNADQLFVLTPTPADARRLGEIAESEELGGEVVIYDDIQKTDSALGTGRQVYGLLSIWWD
jgi:hypothetical protein